MRMCETHLKDTKRMSDEAVIFFYCLDPGSKSNQRAWLEGLQHKILYTLYAQHVKLGECKGHNDELSLSLSLLPRCLSHCTQLLRTQTWSCPGLCTGTVIDQSAEPVTFEDIKAMSGAYAVVGTAEAAVRRLNILFLWYIAGRAAEGAWCLWTGASWSKLHSKLLLEVPQVKVHKPKYAMFGPGLHRNMCILVAFADNWCLHGIGIRVETSPPWILPDLHTTSQPGAKIGAQMKVGFVCVRARVCAKQRASVRV